jgi:prevent-host-death family protein
MKTVSAREANQQFSALLSRAERGEDILITKHAKPVAVLSPYRQPAMTADRIVGAHVAFWLIFDRESFGGRSIATIATWIMTLFIQRAETRDTLAIHAKLDELLRAEHHARNELTTLDQKEPEEIAAPPRARAEAYPRLNLPNRRFPPPWSVKDIGGAFVVTDTAGQELASVYFASTRRR